MINKIKEIVIFGGGTSGWLTAAYMANNLKFPAKITLIESKAIGPIGVGEGTQPATARFLYDAGIMPKTWMKPSNASFKFGVEFTGWTDDTYFVDNDFIENTIIGPGLRTVDYFINKTPTEWRDNLPAYRLAKANKSPKLAGMDTNYAILGLREFGAVHFNAYDILDAIKGIIEDKITYVNTEITQVQQDKNGITGLIDENGVKYTADLYIDCTGFKSMLLEETLGVKFRPLDNFLPCNRAVTIPTQFTDPETECFPYTKATTMNAGWMFTIPTFKQTGNGYVYSDKFITPEQAEQELRDTIGVYDTPAKHLTMKCGSHDVVTAKNVIAVGLSAGFVEPLEATGITFTTKIVEVLTRTLNEQNGVWTELGMNNINQSYYRMINEIVVFVWAHYHYSTRSDTDFWESIRSQTDIPTQFTEVLSKFLPVPHTDIFLDKTSSFHIGHWFSVLHAANLYDAVTTTIEPDTEEYIKYFIKNHDHRVELVKEMFPNHYEFLKKWYSDDSAF